MKHNATYLGRLFVTGSVGLALFGCTQPFATNHSADGTAPIASSPQPTISAQRDPNTPSQAPATAIPDAETLIIPGERVGQVTNNTTFKDLVSLFGAEHLTNQPFSVGEGETRPATRVNLGEARSFTVIWTDESRSRAEAVSQLGTDWKTPEGIGAGMSLIDLQSQLGNFQLYGFAWDYSGTVVLDKTRLAKYSGLLTLRLSPQPGAAESQSADFEAVMGDRLYDSTNPHLQALYPTVDRMIVRLTRK